MFKLGGIVEEATIHIVNLPKGSKVSSPTEAHEGMTNYHLTNEKSEIIGFFSTEHKTIFTHHDTYLHIHLITLDRQKMGHLDDLLFKKRTMTLYLPKEKESNKKHGFCVRWAGEVSPCIGFFLRA